GMFNTRGDGDASIGVEQCDGGNGAPGSPNPRDIATCNFDCTRSVCGDGYRNAQAGEACDDWLLNGTAASPHDFNTSCKINGCGNGLRDINEQCDPGGGESLVD